MLFDLLHDSLVNVAKKERLLVFEQPQRYITRNSNKLFKHVANIFLVNKTSYRLLYSLSLCRLSKFGFFMVGFSIFEYLSFSC